MKCSFVQIRACNSCIILQNMNYNKFITLSPFNLAFGLTLINACQVFSNSGISNVDYKIKRRINSFVIQSGTKWCGPGNLSDSYDDLGPERETDECCRDHDYCPEYILGGETLHNLTNDAYYTRFSCKCDEQFQKCLRETMKKAAGKIGTFYFNLLGTKCFRNDYPTIDCMKRGGWLQRKCMEYTYNRTATKRYQWFDVNEY